MPTHAETQASGRPNLGVRDRWVAAIVALLATTLYWSQRQAPYWSDGRMLVELLDQGKLARHQLLYFPLGQALRAFLELGGSVGARETLELLSAISVGGGLALFYLALRWLGLAASASLLGVALLGTTPSVWFYATTVEVHGLQVGVSCALLLACCRLHALGRIGQPSVLLILLFIVLLGTHMAGGLLLPALLSLHSVRPRAWARPRVLAIGLVAMLGFAAAWILTNSTRHVGANQLFRAARGLLRPWSHELFWREFVLPTGWLIPLVLASLAHTLLRARGALLRPLARGAVVAILVCLPFAGTVWVPERGAYYLSAFVVMAAVGATWLSRWPRGRWGLAVVLLALQTRICIGNAKEWESEYPGHEWASALIEEAEDRGLLIAGSRVEFLAVWCHSSMAVITPSSRSRGELETLGPEVVAVVQKHLRKGNRVALTRSFVEAQGPLGDLADTLIELFGPLEPGAHDAYAFLKRPSSPTPPPAE